MVARILVPVDLTASSDETMRLATSMARDTGASLLVLHVVDAQEQGAALLHRALPSWKDARLLAQLRNLVPSDPRVQCEYAIELGDPATRIVEVAAREHVALIVLRAPRPRWMPRLFRDNVAELVMRKATCPVVSHPSSSPAPSPAEPAFSEPDSDGWGRNSSRRRQVVERLTATLSAEVTGLKVWMQTQESAAAFIGQVPLVRSTTDRLRDLWRQADPARIQRSAALAQLREYFSSVCRSCGYVGFSIHDRAGTVLAATSDELIGQIVRPDEEEHFFERAFDGPVVSHPFRQPARGKEVRGSLTMCAGVPLKLDGADAEPDAVLCLNIRPETDYLRILSADGPGLSLETYTFDERGLLLSNSRFGEQLRRAGVLAPSAGSDGILELRAADPGGNLLQGFQPTLPVEKRPLTRMAAFATVGQEGVDLDGYRDYRGVDVVGAWMWLPEYQLGIATEMDLVEVA